MVNSCVPSNLDKRTKSLAAVTVAAIKRKIDKYRSAFLVTYTLLLLIESMFGILGLDTQAFNKTRVVRCTILQDDTPIGRKRAAAEGRETVHFRRHFSFVPQHALSLRTWPHLSR